MEKVGRPKKFGDEYINKMKMLIGTDPTTRTIQNFIYFSKAFGVVNSYIENGKEIKYVKDYLIDPEEQGIKGFSILVELGRLYDFIENYEGEEVAEDFLLKYTENLLIVAKDNNFKSKEMQQEIRDKKKEIKAIYK